MPASSLSLYLFPEQLLEFMHQLPAFANMTMSVRRELCAVMVFAVVERAGTIVLNDGEEVSVYVFVMPLYIGMCLFFWDVSPLHTSKPLFFN